MSLKFWEPVGYARKEILAILCYSGLVVVTAY